MKVSSFALIAIISLAGCASNQVKEIAPLAISAKSLPSPNIEPSDTSILGVVLNKHFGGFPECPIKRNYLDKNKFEYDSFSNITCYSRLNGKIASNEPLGTESIYVSWSVMNESIPLYIKGLNIELLDGVVHEIRANTRGINYQIQITNDLINKFGKPTTNEINSFQNKMGAKFDIKYLTWSLPNKTSITFVGALTNINEGYIFATTEKMNQINRLKNENRESKRPKL